MVTKGTATARVPEAGVPPGRSPAPRLVYEVIAVCVAAAAFLRFYQLARPGYLLGVTEYDDGVQFGGALRMVSGVIPYRDFVVVQPPGSILLMAPIAALAKVTGSAWGLAIARVLTACADTACVALLGLLVRHRGAVATGVACGIYAVYPDALVPLAVIGLLLLHRPRRLAALAGGAAAGLGILVLPFLAMAPRGLAKDVV